MGPAKLHPALLGGTFIGVLSALPIVAIGNFCCCLWIVGGGVIAAFLMQQNHPQAISIADGAVGGFLAGIVGAVIYVIVAVPVQVLLAPLQEEMTRRLLDSARNVPPEVRDMLSDVNVDAGGILLQFVFILGLGITFGTAGGALGAVMFSRAPQPLSPPPAA